MGALTSFVAEMVMLTWRTDFFYFFSNDFFLLPGRVVVAGGDEITLEVFATGHDEGMLEFIPSKSLAHGAYTVPKQFQKGAYAVHKLFQKGAYAVPPMILLYHWYDDTWKVIEMTRVITLARQQSQSLEDVQEELALTSTHRVSGRGRGVGPSSS
ncbi:hypothetical protein LguiB_022915 [Lonicera macranthoides]